MGAGRFALSPTALPEVSPDGGQGNVEAVAPPAGRTKNPARRHRRAYRSLTASLRQTVATF